jgi:hypothetical protein
MNDEQIAKTAYEVNRVYSESLGDFSNAVWELAPEWQRNNTMLGIEFIKNNPNATLCEIHENWLATKYEEGWKWGEVKDIGKKEHPCCLPYDDLPLSQRTKDILFFTIVTTLLANHEL